MVLTIVHYRNRKEREHYMVLGKNPDSTLVGKCGFSVPVMFGHCSWDGVQEILTQVALPESLSSQILAGRH